jgi:hypothetical protein
MRIHYEELAEIKRYIENQKHYALQGKARQYERYLRLIRKARNVDSGTQMLEHVERWYDRLARVYRAVRPGGVLLFESDNKFSLKPAEFPMPFYGWLPDRLRYRLRIMVQGPEIMTLGIYFNQFQYPQLRRTLREIGFKTILDAGDLSDRERLREIERALMATAKRNALARRILLTVRDATTLVCTK